MIRTDPLPAPKHKATHLRPNALPRLVPLHEHNAHRPVGVRNPDMDWCPGRRCSGVSKG